MKGIFLFSMLLCLSFCFGCAEKIDAPASVAKVPDSPWTIKPTDNDEQKEDVAAAELYAACASCHMADGRGRSDGLVPKLAGQREKVLVHKLHKLRDGDVLLPVMAPFARALKENEVTQVSRYIVSLPETLPDNLTGTLPDKLTDNMAEKSASKQDYLAYCSACHGTEGQGNDALLAPKLCGQHKLYLTRRMTEIESNSRGDADSGMLVILNEVNLQKRQGIARWLASGQCENRGEHNE